MDQSSLICAHNSQSEAGRPCGPNNPTQDTMSSLTTAVRMLRRNGHGNASCANVRQDAPCSERNNDDRLQMNARPVQLCYEAWFFLMRHFAILRSFEHSVYYPASQRLLFSFTQGDDSFATNQTPHSQECLTNGCFLHKRADCERRKMHHDLCNV